MSQSVGNSHLPLNGRLCLFKNVDEAAKLSHKKVGGSFRLPSTFDLDTNSCRSSLPVSPSSVSTSTSSRKAAPLMAGVGDGFAMRQVRTSTFDMPQRGNTTECPPRFRTQCQENHHDRLLSSIRTQDPDKTLLKAKKEKKIGDNSGSWRARIKTPIKFESCQHLHSVDRVIGTLCI